MKRLMMLFLALFIGLSPDAMASGIQERVDNAQRRIERGISSGALTRQEGHRLRDEFRQIRRDERRALADGHMDRRERERLNQELDRLERHISHLKHNDARSPERHSDRYR